MIALLSERIAYFNVNLMILLVPPSSKSVGNALVKALRCALIILMELCHVGHKSCPMRFNNLWKSDADLLHMGDKARSVVAWLEVMVCQINIHIYGGGVAEELCRGARLGDRRRRV